MKFLADVNISPLMIRWIVERGHDVDAAAAMGPGVADLDLLRHAAEHRQIIVTSDRDFGELVFLRGEGAAGILYLRLPDLLETERVHRLAEVWPRVVHDLCDHFTTVDSRRVRRRPMP